MDISAALGEAREIRLGQGSVRYRDVGRGEPIQFVHGVLVNGELWREVVPRQSRRLVASDGYMRPDEGKETAVGVTTGR